MQKTSETKQAGKTIKTTQATKQATHLQKTSEKQTSRNNEQQNKPQ